jgi:tetratricopeptide (TPR) repeat protein
MFVSNRQRLLLTLMAAVTVAGVYGAPAPSRVKIKKRTTVLRAPMSMGGDEAEIYNAEKSVILSQKRRSLIEDIKRFIRDSRDNEQAAELNLRLGKLYMEDYYANMSKAHQEFDTAQTAFDKKKKGKAPTLDTTEAKTSLSKARSVYKDLLRRAPNHPRRDEVLYFLAVSSMDEGKMEEAMRHFERIVRELPKSKYYNDALVQLGDYFFDKNKFRDAESYFDRIIARKFLILLPYATYKKGWCAYNREAYSEAIKAFKWVITFADSEADGSALRIRGEAMRDIALPFTELKATDEAITFFQAQGMPFFRNGLENMSSIYSEKGHHAESIKLDEQLLAMDANYAKNSDYDIRVVESLKGMNRDDLALARLMARLPNYIGQSNWYEINSGNPTIVQGANKNWEDLTRNFGVRTHAIAQKTKNEALYNRAKSLYEKYVEFFPATDNTALIRFSLAEIQFRQQAYVPSAENYYKVYEDPRGGKLRKEGIRYALSAYDQQLNSDRKKAGLSAINTKTTSKLIEKDDESLDLIAYSATESRFLQIGTEYLKQYSTAKDAGDVLYEQAYLRYTHHDFNDAFRDFFVLVQKYPAHETATSSAYLILDILNRRKDYPKLIAACQKFLEIKEFKKPAFRSEVSDILRKAELKRIAQFEEKGQFKDAADNYVEYTKAYGTLDEALFEKALYNAAIDYTKAGLLLPAVETQERFLRRFPKSKWRESMVLQVAKTYETLANFDKSGRYFEEFANTYPNHAQSKNALRLAGVYLAGSGHGDRAEAIFARFLRMYPADAKQVERDLLSLYEAQNATDKTFRYYLTARAARGVPFSEYLSYTMAAAEVAAAKSGHLPPQLMDEARRIADKYGPEIRKTPKGVEALAKVRFWWVSQREALFHHYKLALPQATLEANLKRKLLLLQELEREYGKIASLGNAEWGLGAIYKTAAVYRHMAESIQTAPVPAELDAAALEQYRGELKRQMIDPFNEKAKNFAANCLDKSQEFNVMSAWTSQCYGLASELDPARYPRVRTFYLPPMTLALQVPPKDSKTEMGSLKRFAYPFYSSALFSGTRQLASMAPIDLPMIYDLSRGNDGQSSSPNPANYEALTTERRNVLKNNYDSEKPDDMRKGASFSFLNLMRLVSAARAIPMIETAIQRDPENTALVNLLGLAYLESGKAQGANVSWLSLVARGQATASVWNNLGVAAAREGNEAQAIIYFQEAIKLPGAKESFINMGFLALKYRNGFEAKNYFKKALKLDDDDVSAQIGLAVASLQNREVDDAKDMLVDLSHRYSKDPYLKLSLGYFLIDVEHEMEAAQKIVNEYMESQSLDKDMTFRQLLLETRHRADAGGVEDSVD